MRSEPTSFHIVLDFWAGLVLFLKLSLMLVLMLLLCWMFLLLLKGEYGGHDVELIRWQKCQRWTAKTFFKIFWFSQVPAAWPVKFYSHFHTPSLRICIHLYCSFIHPCVASSYTRSALTSDPFQHWRHPTPRSQKLSPNFSKWRHLEYNFEFAYLFAVTIV